MRLILTPSLCDHQHPPNSHRTPEENPIYTNEAVKASSLYTDMLVVLKSFKAMPKKAVNKTKC
jgi:hypothetical protein